MKRRPVWVASLLCHFLTECFHVNGFARQPGFLHGKGHQMAFHGTGNGTAGTCAVAGQKRSEILHDAVITAAVAAAIGTDIDDSLCECITMTCHMTPDHDLLRTAIGFDLTVFAHNVNMAEAGAGLSGE